MKKTLFFIKRKPIGFQDGYFDSLFCCYFRFLGQKDIYYLNFLRLTVCKIYFYQNVVYYWSNTIRPIVYLYAIQGSLPGNRFWITQISNNYIFLYTVYIGFPKYYFTQNAKKWKIISWYMSHTELRVSTIFDLRLLNKNRFRNPTELDIQLRSTYVDLFIHIFNHHSSIEIIIRYYIEHVLFVL